MNFFRRPPKKSNELKDVLLSFKRIFLYAGIFSFIMNILMLTPAIYMLQIYDRVLVSRNMVTLVTYTILMLGLYLLLALIEWIRARMLVRAGNDIDRQLSNKTFTVAFTNALRVGSANAQQAFSDLTQIRQFLTGRGLFAFFDVPWTPLYIIISFMLHPSIGILAVISTIILIILTYVTELVSSRPIKESNEYHRKASTFANINFRNYEAIESMGMLNNVRKVWFPMQLKMLSKQSQASDRAATISSITKFVRLASQSLVYGVGSYFVIKNELTPGQMIAGSIIVGKALAPIDGLMATWKQFIVAKNSYNRLTDLFSLYDKKDITTKLPAPTGELEVKGIVVTPPNSNVQIIRGMSFQAFPGDIIGVLGPSASGKTSLARALVGVWKPLVGEIRLDGAEYHQWEKEELGQYIGYLPQSIELLDGTIAQNIARFGEIDSDKVIKAAKMADVHDMILSFKDGYDTYIGEGGIALSGGQKQRVALARAIYGDPVLIVLDEPNSNLDEKGELALVNTLRKLKEKKRTVFVITHRKAILSEVNKVMVIAGGALQLYGRKEEVFARLAAASEQLAGA
jgi:ATP-binding cassette subfamily C exporter for protease/lipase/ATP-binding cassette subfamily C protein EexD